MTTRRQATPPAQAPRTRRTATQKGSETRGKRWPRPPGVPEGDPYLLDSVAVYRLYNTAGALLYVGISDHPRRRFGDHAESQPWWGDVASWEVVWSPNRLAAAAEELRAIHHEVPAFNAAGVPLPGDGRNLRDEWIAQLWQRRPTRDDLAALLITSARVQSLRQWGEARLPLELDAATELYEWARSQAGLSERWAHRRFVTTWTAEQSVIEHRGRVMPVPGVLPDWTRSDGPLLRWVTTLLDGRPAPQKPGPPREPKVKPFRPPVSVRTSQRVAAETFAGMNGLRCRATDLPVQDCDCHSRHVVTAFEERRFGLTMGAPFGVPARPWRRQGERGVLAALRRFAA